MAGARATRGAAGGKTPPRVLLGVTGGIAAYKALELVRLFRKAGWDVQVVMTRHSRKLVGPESFSALSGRPVAHELFPRTHDARHMTREASSMEREALGVKHIDLAAWADLVVVAPATANILGKLASGIADDLLSTLLLAVPAATLDSGKVILVPAMNTHMWQHPSVQQNVGRLIENGYTIVGPEHGELACGAYGAGRLVDPQTIFRACEFALQEKARIPDLAGKRVLVTAGRTEEPIDPVRIITNRSSGRTGTAIAQAFAAARASVTLIAGPVAVPLPQGMELIRVSTTEQMLKAVLTHIHRADVLVMCAAVADFRPARPARAKHHQNSLELALKRTPDILTNVSRMSHHALVIGFSLDPSVTRARTKLRTKNLDLVVANDYSTPGVETIKATLIAPKAKPRSLPEMPKERFAYRLVAETARLLRSRKEVPNG